MNPLPEEKLLKLIRGKGRAPAGTPAAAPAQDAGTVAVIPALPSARIRSRYGTRVLIGGLGCLLAVEFILLIVQALRPPPHIEVPALPDASQAPGAPPDTLPPVPSLAQSVSRPLFSPSTDGAGSASEPSGSRQAPSGSANLLASRLTLMGIIAGNPGQAIIEDSQTKKTFFVSPGQTVVDGAVVDQVLDNRVILDLQGEKIELTL